MKWQQSLKGKQDHNSPFLELISKQNDMTRFSIFGLEKSLVNYFPLGVGKLFAFRIVFLVDAYLPSSIDNLTVGTSFAIRFPDLGGQKSPILIDTFLSLGMPCVFKLFLVILPYVSGAQDWRYAS